MIDRTIDVVDALPEFYLPYSAYVLQTRALPDARDGLKTGARFILYSQYSKGITHKNKFRKGTATVAETMMFSPHGDQSIYGNAIRMAQPFALRYPVIEAQGNVGTQVYGDDYAAQRYVELRGGEIADEMLGLLEKETVPTWKWNYSQEKQYPTVLPSKFPFGLVNGSFGIGISCSSSIPQFNLNDVCNALIKMIRDKNVTFEDVYCPVDFATGGIVVNENEVKESLKNGRGKSIVIRAKMIFDEKENELVVTETPYQVFTSTIMKQLQNKIDEGVLKGVESAFDGTGKDGIRIHIKLAKGVDPKVVAELLYSHTSLQSNYSVNMMMLEDGKIPRIFSWQDAMKTYLNHLSNIMKRSYEFDLSKILKREEILLGFVKALPNIDAIIKVIRNSDDTESAKTNLAKSFDFTLNQVVAILALRLSSLSKLEKYKIDRELKEIQGEKDRLTKLLKDESVFNSSLESEVERIKSKYGDKRRTQNLNLEVIRNDDEAESANVVEKVRATAYCSNLNNCVLEKTTTAFIIKKDVFKARGEFLAFSCSKEEDEEVFYVTNDGYLNFISSSESKQKLNGTVVGMFSMKRTDNSITILTKKGRFKKISSSECWTTTKKKIIKLEEDDSVASAFKNVDGFCGILTKDGFFCIINTERERETKCTAMGYKMIKLDQYDAILSAKNMFLDDSLSLIFETSSKDTIVRSTPSSFLFVRGSNLKKAVEESQSISNFTLGHGA